jgi:N-glycosidase YbiA
MFKQIKFLTSKSTSYPERTSGNALADVTIAFATNFNSAGEILTKRLALEQGKFYLPIDANNLNITEERIYKIVNALNKVNKRISKDINTESYTNTQKFNSIIRNTIVYNTYKKFPFLGKIDILPNGETLYCPFMYFLKNILEDPSVELIVNNHGIYAKSNKLEKSIIIDIINLFKNPIFNSIFKTINKIEKCLQNTEHAFKNEAEFLSNFSPYHKSEFFNYKNLLYPSNEHFYQAMKFVDINDQKLVIQYPSKGLKKICRELKSLDENFNKNSIMWRGLNYKFSLPRYSAQLALTLNNNLAEYNYWNDQYWGICKNKGENHLGKMLMKIRENQQLHDNSISINIAGNGLYTMKNKYSQRNIDNFVLHLLSKVFKHPDFNKKVQFICSGGQTGFDESGAKLGYKLNLDTYIYTTADWKFKKSDGKTVTNNINQFKERFYE